ncbi:MAG: DEAD/DEAH box helicase [Fimbriiglobus sp.]|nr:DEAD/DEAH box helicase [Fimbriiglobus sp.]
MMIVSAERTLLCPHVCGLQSGAIVRIPCTPPAPSGGKVRFVTESPIVSPFAALGLSAELAAAVEYSTPSPIQAQAIPPLLAGKDLVGVAATGTGKTAAFALPLVHRLGAADNRDRRKPAALILVPTRELAVQVAKAVSGYGKPHKIKVVPVYGGAGFAEQVRGLRQHADVVVATPGRAHDHLRRGTLDLSGLLTVVLDEADEMMDMGFAEDIEALLSAAPSGRQTVLFSATMPARIAAIAAKHQTDPVRVQIAAPVPAAGAAPKVKELVYHVRQSDKPAALARLLAMEPDATAIVFCRTRNDADGLAGALTARGFKPEAIHGGLNQEQRDRVMGRFRDGTARVLVATDVAARGLDIGHLSHVVNYHLPEMAETYVHRIGRVGRAGREGTAITLLDPRERGLMVQVERTTNRRMTPAQVPTKSAVRGKQTTATAEALRAKATAGGLDDVKKLLAPLLADLPAEDVAAAAVALLTAAQRPADHDPEVIAPAAPAQPARMRPPVGSRGGYQKWGSRR